MGGLVNAVFWMLGPQEADDLLHDYKSTIIDEIWFKFVQHVNHVLRSRFILKRLKQAVEDILLIDDTYPLVVHLKATDNSQNHAVCLFNNHIYDSASRYILTKSRDALNWCCGVYDFARSLRIYQLQPKVTEEKPSVPHGKKKRRRKRYG